MNEQQVLEILGKVNAVITDSHIVYTSGRHGSAYVNKDAIYPHTGDTSRLCQAIAQEYVNDGIEVVIAPAIGGVILSQWTAHHLGELMATEVLSLYAEKSEDGHSFVIKRGYDRLIKGKRVLVVEDVLTTGGSVKAVIEAVRELGGEVVGVGVLCNRGGITAEDIGGVPKMTALVNVNLESWPESQCPLCEKQVPINTNVGKGREFLSQKKQE